MALRRSLAARRYIAITDHADLAMTGGLDDALSRSQGAGDLRALQAPLPRVRSASCEGRSRTS